MDLNAHASMGRQNELNEEMRLCIQNCRNTHEICLLTINHCLTMGGKHAEPAHIRLLQDCAEICQTSANFMLRMSDLHGAVCGVCAEVCEACAVSCDAFPDDARMAQCAEMCRVCAQSCREMAAGAA